MSLVSIEIGERGVERVVSSPRTIAEAKTASEIQAKTAFAVRLLHDTVSGFSESTAPQLSLSVPRYVEPGAGVDEFEQIELGLAEVPRPLHDNPAPWFVDAIRKAYPSHFAWAAVGLNCDIDWIAVIRKVYPSDSAFSSVGDALIHELQDVRERRKSRRRRADSKVEVLTETEIAEFILLSMHGANGKSTDRFLDEHTLGFVNDKKKGVVLVSDLYVADEAAIAAVQNFVFDAGLRFEISGTSSYHPSKTLRIAVWRD